MTTFRKFTERNDSEGETWHFWLQVEGNESELEHLAEFIAKDEDYQLAPDAVPEAEVDIIVKHTDEGYMPYHQKVTGRMVFQSKLPTDDDACCGYWPGDWFYKGEIKAYFTE